MPKYGFLRNCLLAFFTFLLLLFVLWLAAPALIKWQGEKQLSKALGRNVSIGEVSFKPWSLELALLNVSIDSAAGGEKKQIELKRIYADASISSLFRLAPVLDAIEVDGPKIRLAHLGGGKYDIDDILGRFAKKDEPDSEGKKPTNFALYNIKLIDGEFSFNDAQAGVFHDVKNIEIGVPFISNLPSKRQVHVEPRLAFEANGSVFETAVQTLPFSDSLTTTANLDIKSLDLSTYAPYIPQSVPIKLISGILNANLAFNFQESKSSSPRFHLSGDIDLDNISANSANNLQTVKVEKITANLANISALAGDFHISNVKLLNPTVGITLSSDKTFKLSDSKSENATKPKLEKDSKSNLLIKLDNFEIDGGAIDFADKSVELGNYNLRDINARVSHFQWPLSIEKEQGALIDLKANLDNAQITAAGTLNQELDLKTNLQNLQLKSASPYITPHFLPELSGQAELSAHIQIPILKNGENVNNQILLEEIIFNKISAKQDKKNLFTLEKINLENALIDLNKKKFTLDKILLTAPQIDVLRAEDTKLMYENWLPAKSANKKDDKKQEKNQTWSWQINEAGLTNAKISWQDKAINSSENPKRKPFVKLDFSQIKANIKNINSENSGAMDISLITRMGRDKSQGGRFSWKGSINLKPEIAIKGKADAKNLPLQLLTPYFADKLNVRILRADSSFAGQTNWAKIKDASKTEIYGDVLLNNWQAQTISGVEEELFSFAKLKLEGLKIDLSPQKEPNIEVAKTFLDDFFTRIIISPEGRINLQDIIKTSTSQTTEDLNENTSAKIKIGPSEISGGKILFTDHFIRPNYSADLSNLSGTLSEFNSSLENGLAQMADIKITGNAQQTAELIIEGRLNPLAKPLALDISANVRDLEMPPLSPYSVKYTGHPIERGKFSMNVNYQIKPDGQLTANNNLILNQLTFGNPVESAPTKLPVQLATALLSDSSGVIDLDLPISGSLNDPQFSLGPVIFKAVINIIGRAITAPFSLLGKLIGGSAGQDMSQITFDAGSNNLTKESKEQLDKIAKALKERPQIKLTAIGQANIKKEESAYKKQKLEKLIMQQARAELSKDEDFESSDENAPIKASNKLDENSEEYKELLKKIYRRSDVPNKPRNAIGMLKDISTAEMQEKLLAQIKISQDDMAQLAISRANEVKNYLQNKDKALSERLFVGQPKIKIETKLELNSIVELNLDAK